MFHSTMHHATVPKRAFRLGGGHARKLGLYPVARNDVVEGCIGRISTDAVEGETMSLVYSVVRLLNAHFTVDGVRRALAAGLVATTKIKTGQRRIIEPLPSPPSQRDQDGGRER